MELVSSSSQPEDAVVRLQRFQIENPDVAIMSPVDTQSPFWKCYVDGQQVTVQHSLAAFVDVLEVLAEKGEL
jgi:hypothetical protein